MRYDATKLWKFVCRECWPKAPLCFVVESTGHLFQTGLDREPSPSHELEGLWAGELFLKKNYFLIKKNYLPIRVKASGRVSSREAGGGEGNPLYQYGGTWKAVTGQHKL